MPHEVPVNDNCHYSDSDYRYRAGEFETAEEAIARCRQLVDECLDDTEKIKLNGHDPRAYLKNVFKRLPTLKNRDLAQQLLPHNWRPVSAAVAEAEPAPVASAA